MGVAPRALLLLLLLLSFFFFLFFVVVAVACLIGSTAMRSNVESWCTVSTL